MARIFSIFSRQTTTAVKWIVVAGGDGARIFEKAKRNGPLRLIREIDFPEGRLQNRQIDTDKGGRLFGGRGRGPRRHAASTREDATSHLSGKFADSLAQMLENAKNRDLYDQLVLVAEPKLMGKLHASIGRNSAKALVQSIEKDLEGIPTNDILKSGPPF